MRFLVITDSPANPSGLGRVGREIALGLARSGHQVGYIGLFHNVDNVMIFPPNVKVWYTNNQHFGADMIDQIVNGLQPDVVLTIGDVWNYLYVANPAVCRTRRHFQWSHYIAIDGEPIGGGIPPDQIPALEDVDIPVAYTHYAKNAILKSVTDPETRRKLRVIYHGVDTSVFGPWDPKERKAIRQGYGLDDKFVFLTVSRNQSRKNIPEMFRAWKLFSELPETRGKVIFWPHMHFKDSAGWDIDNLIDVLKLRNRSIFYYNQVAHGPGEMTLIPDQELAKLYRIADAFLLISGEGFGLPIFEAMASGLPCVLLDYAAASELGAEGRAELVPTDERFTFTGRYLTQRPIPQPEAIVEAMLKVYRDEERRKKIAKAGQEFARQYTWERVVRDWDALFLETEVPFMKPLEMEVVA